MQALTWDQFISIISPRYKLKMITNQVYTYTMHICFIKSLVWNPITFEYN